MTRIAISIRGGLVSAVYTDIDNLQVHVLDHDVGNNATVEIDDEAVCLYPVCAENLALQGGDAERALGTARTVATKNGYRSCNHHSGVP